MCAHRAGSRWHDAAMVEPWEFTVRLVGGRSHPGDPIVAVGTLSGGALPKEPTTVTIYGRDSVVVVEGAHEIDHVRHSVAEGLHGLVLPGVPRAAIATGSRIVPSNDQPVAQTPPRRAFSGRVGLSPDYGGVIFRTGIGMADVDSLEHRIPTALQDALWSWYLEWNEKTSTNRWSAAEFVAEGERLVDALNDALEGECEFHLDL
jgi:hypothetical protein